MKKIIKNEEIEQIVNDRIREYEARRGKITTPRIPIEDIVEDCGFKILYEKIDEKPGEKILGGLSLDPPVIVLNETHMKLFQDKPGLERSTLAHELGHWDVYKTATDNGLTLDFHVDSKEVLFRSSLSGSLIVADVWSDEDIYDVLKAHISRKDHPYVASAVDRYANYLLIPKKIVLDFFSREDVTVWKNLYSLAEILGVTISALCVRLSRMNLIYIKNKKIYRTKDEAVGQACFKF